MHLPKILIERYGWPGFIAFTVPNVLGCAAFGYVLRDHDPRGRSEAFVLRHIAAMRWFSFITIAFHIFFITAFVRGLDWSARFPMVEVGLSMFVLLVGFGLSFLRNRSWLIVAVLVGAVSLSVFIAIGTNAVSTISWAGALPASSLIWLLPVMCFGFLLCPYLDLTFHRALQHSPSRHSFLAFGVIFLVIIVMTAVYWADPSRAAGLWLMHLLVQSIFTVGAHLRELERTVAPRRWMPQRRWLWALPLAGLLAYAPAANDAGPFFWEGNYLRCLVFYGLVFPAYVILAGWAWRGRRPGRMQIVLLSGAVMLSLPLYEVGFIGGATWMTGIPVGVLLTWSILARRHAAAAT